MPLDAAGVGAAGDVGGGIGGAIGSVYGMATANQGGKKFLQAAIKAWEKLQTSNFDYRALSPPELQLIAQYKPEVYNAVVPPEVRQAGDSAAGRGAQLGGINYFQDVRDKGLPIETRLAVEEAQRGIGQEHQRGQDAILQEMQARGRLGGGSELSARIGQDQQSMELAHRMGNDLARREIEARMNAAGAAAQIGGQERAGTIGLGQFNANAVNNFNQWLANAQNEAAQYNAGARERAQFGNVENTQRIGETNELNRYNTELENLNRQNRLKGDLFQQQLAQTQGLTGAYGNMAEEADLRRAEKMRNYSNIGRGIGQGGGSLIGLGI